MFPPQLASKHSAGLHTQFQKRDLLAVVPLCLLVMVKKQLNGENVGAPALRCGKRRVPADPTDLGTSFNRCEAAGVAEGEGVGSRPCSDQSVGFPDGEHPARNEPEKMSALLYA